MNRFWSYKLNLVCRESNKYSKSFQFSQQFQSSQSGLSRSMPRSDSRLSNNLSRCAIQSHDVSAEASCRAFNRSKVHRAYPWVYRLQGLLCQVFSLTDSGFHLPVKLTHDYRFPADRHTGGNHIAEIYFIHRWQREL